MAIDEAAYGPDHPIVETDLNNLAQLFQDTGEYEMARRLLECSPRADPARAVVAEIGTVTHRLER